MPLTNDLAKLAEEANAIFNSVTANSTAITSMSVAGQVINSTGFGVTSTFTNTFTIGTSTYFASNGNIGIGTSSPEYKMDVLGAPIRFATNTTSGYMSIQLGRSSTNTNNWHFNSEGNGDFMVYNGNWGSGAARLKLTSSGALVLPGHPAFYATHGNSTTSTGTVVWPTAIFNIGSCYNTSTGRFTAPVTGTYFFRAHTLIQNPTGGEVRMALYKNDSGYGGSRFITIKPANNWWTILCEGHMYLNANEYATVYMEQNPTTLYQDAGYNSFSGHLVG